MIAPQVNPPPAEAKETIVATAGRPGNPVKFTLDNALAMVQLGIVPEDSTVELLDGELVYVDRIGKESDTLEGANHYFVINAFPEVNERLRSPSRHLRTQSTLACADGYAFVPDALVLRGTRHDFRGRIPRPTDTFAVIDVSESTYANDAGEKRIAYARAGIAQYVIVNLNNRTAEVYTGPDAASGTYSARQVIPADGVLALRVGDAESFDVPLAERLP